MAADTIWWCFVPVGYCCFTPVHSSVACLFNALGLFLLPPSLRLWTTDGLTDWLTDGRTDGRRDVCVRACVVCQFSVRGLEAQLTELRVWVSGHWWCDALECVCTRSNRPTDENREKKETNTETVRQFYSVDVQLQLTFSLPHLTRRVLYVLLFFLPPPPLLFHCPWLERTSWSVVWVF